MAENDETNRGAYESLHAELVRVKSEIDGVRLSFVDEVTQGVVSGLLRQASDSLLASHNFVKYMMDKETNT